MTCCRDCTEAGRHDRAAGAWHREQAEATDRLLVITVTQVGTGPR